jgi:hypothetical protein
MNLGAYLPQHHTQEDYWICFNLQFLTGLINPLVECSCHSEHQLLLLTTETSSVGLENTLYVFVSALFTY